MPFKTIMVKKSVYEKIVSHKKKDESFSDLFDRTYEEKRSGLMRFYGCLNLTEEETKTMKREIAENRKRADRNFHERMKHALS